MAVSTKRSASHAFSIDSLMSKQPREELSSPVSPPQASSVTPPTTPHLPTANNYAQFLRSFESQYLGGIDPLGFGVNHPIFAGALPSSLPGHIASLPPTLHPLLLAGSAPSATPRDSIFNPWLQLARQQSVFGQRFNGDNQGLLMHPFRKPKRIRTAFSPSQLLKLEQSFEKNHYVVGQERKDLAANLGLTETQVKVWFQNRRTKHKRTKDGSEDGLDGQKYDDSEIEEEEDLEICDDSEYNSSPAKRQCRDGDSNNIYCSH